MPFKYTPLEIKPYPVDRTARRVNRGRLRAKALAIAAQIRAHREMAKTWQAEGKAAYSATWKEWHDRQAKRAAEEASMQVKLKFLGFTDEAKK